MTQCGGYVLNSGSFSVWASAVAINGNLRSAANRFRAAMAGTRVSAPGTYKPPAGYRKSICVSTSKNTVFIANLHVCGPDREAMHCIQPGGPGEYGVAPRGYSRAIRSRTEAVPPVSRRAARGAAKHRALDAGLHSEHIPPRIRQ